MQEFAYFSQFAGTGLAFLQMAIVICFFVAVLFGESRIRYPSLFRLACFFLILSIILPPILGPLLTSSFASPRSGFSQDGQWLMLMVYSSGPVLLGASLFLAFGSLTIGPSARTRSPRPTPAKKHPLDD